MKMHKSIIFVRKKLKMNISKINYHKVTDHCHYTGEYRGIVHSICNLKYSVPEKIPVVFHNGSNYDYHFIVKDGAEDTGKYTTFTVSIENKVTRIDKNGEEITNHISYMLKFIDGA